MRNKFKELPVIIDVLVIMYVSIALWFVYKDDMFGFTSILKYGTSHISFVPSTILEKVVAYRLYLFAFLFFVLAVGLYLLKRWSYWLTLALNGIIIFSAPLILWKIFALATIVYLIFDREYFAVGSFRRPELHKIVHVEYDHGRKMERVDIEEKKDVKLEEMISRGDYQRARAYSDDMIKVAKQVGDLQRIVYYEKYIEKINYLSRRTMR